MVVTRHAEQRMSQRGISLKDIALVVDRGVEFHKSGVVFFFMRQKDVKTKEEDRLVGTVVCLSSTHVILTVYKNRRGLNAIKRKPKWGSNEWGSNEWGSNE